MARETGVVLKTQGNRLVVLTPGGEFRTVPRTKGTAGVGQEIEFAWPAARTNWRLLMAAASLFLVLVAGTLFSSIFPAAGYVSVDINPSIELGMNAWGRVVTADGLNSDGKNLLRSLPLYGRPLDQALNGIAQKAVALHYLKQGDPDNLMVVTYTPGRLIQLHRQEQAYQALAGQFQSDRTPVRLVFARMTRQERTQARKLGLSAGKYLVRERLAQKGVQVTAEQMAQTSIANLLRDRKMQVDAIMGPDTVYRDVMPATSAPAGTGSRMTAGRAPAKPVRQWREGTMGTAARVARSSAWKKWRKKPDDGGSVNSGQVQVEPGTQTANPDQSSGQPLARPGAGSGMGGGSSSGSGSGSSSGSGSMR